MKHVHKVGMQHLDQLFVLLTPGSVIYDALLLIYQCLTSLAPSCCSVAGLLFPKIVYIYVFLVDVVYHFV